MICIFFFTCYTVRTTIMFSTFSLNILLKLLEKWATQIKVFNIPLLVCKRMLNICEIPYIYDRFVIFVSVNQMLQELVIPCIIWILRKQTAAWHCTTLLVKGKNWILMDNSYLGTPPIRKIFGIRMVNS